MDFLATWAGSVWEMLVDSAFLLLLGIFLAGIIHLFLSEKALGKLLRGGKFAVIFKSAAVGTPLPLCSCSVLPVAHQLRQSGLSRGGTAAFLISTPETGVDSILLTYSLMDPLMTVARPVAGFVTAMAAGLTIDLSDSSDMTPGTSEPQVEKCDDCGHESQNKTSLPFFNRLYQSLRYAFVDMLGDLSWYLIIGYVLAGLVAAIIGSGMVGVPEAFRTGWAGYAAALVIGLPLYVCATSSTPLAAVLLAGGFSPGAIMVFLLVGPATNIASLAVVKKILGGLSLARYLAAIIIMAIASGIVVDFAYGFFDYAPRYVLGETAEHISWVNIIAAAFFAVYITYLGAVRLARRKR